MAYEDWEPEFQEVWDELPGIPLFREYEYNEAADLFERGFTHHADEPGYDREDAMAARDEFFEFTGLPEELFDWDGWREAMGYND
jgi:hypothetical protein